MREVKLAVIAGLLSGAAWPSIAQAQSADDGIASEQADDGVADQQGNQLTTIIVTARKRSEDIQTVPVTVSAVDGDYIEDQQFVNAIELARDVPGLQIKSGFAASNPTIFIRGIGINDTSPATSGAVGVTLDGVFLNSSIGQLFQMYDLDRVEVLKGPQGTLYGRNTTGGVINYFTKRPGFDFDPSLRVSYGRFDEFNIDAASSIPLVDDLLTARISFSLKRRDGVRADLQNDIDTNDIDQTAIRGQLLFTPTDTLEILAKVEGGINRSTFYTTKGFGIIDPDTGGLCSTEDILASRCANALGYIDTPDPFTARYGIADQREDLDNFAATLFAEWSGEDLTVTSIGSYVSNERNVVQDIDSSPLRLLDQTDSFGKSKQWSQELRLAYDNDSGFSAVIGAFYLSEDLRSDQTFELLGEIPSQLGVPVLDFSSFILSVRSQYEQETDSVALFGETSFDLTERLSATAGFRYTWEDKSIIQGSLFGPVPADLVTPRRLENGTCCLVGDLDSVDPGIGLPTEFNDESLSFNEPSWRLSLDYEATPDLFLFGSYARGVRAGGFNSGAILDPLAFNTVEAEKIDSFEIGIKSDLFDGAVRANASAYYNTGEIQVNTLLSEGVPVAALDSASIKSYGLEWDVRARLSSRLDVTLAGALFEGEFTNYPGTPANVGNQLPNSPKFSIAGSAQYVVPVSDNWDVRFFTDLNYQSKVFFQPSNEDIQSRAGVATWNARIALAKADNGLEIGAYIRNITDEVYLIDIFDVADFGFFQANFSYPRTYGVSFSWSY